MARDLYRWIGSALLLASMKLACAQQTAAIRGVVHNTAGTPQLGVAVEVLRGNTQVANTFTDLNGRFLIRGLIPGLYQLRATAILYAPMLRSRMLLRPGDLPSLDVTLSSLFEQAWPETAVRHTVDLPDDWRWTLRSSSNRPLLRVATSGATQTESPRAKVEVHRRAQVAESKGGFGQSGTTLRVEEQRASGDHLTSTEVNLTQVPITGAGFDLREAFEVAAPSAPIRRFAVRLRSRPEIQTAGQVQGAVQLDAAGGERLLFGDTASIEAGSLLRALHVGQTAITSYPFLQAQASLMPGWQVGYGFATHPGIQSLEDVGLADASLPDAGGIGGRLRLERGLHQAGYVRRRVGRGMAEAVLEHESLDRVVLLGQSHPVVSPLRQGVQSPLLDLASGGTQQLHNGYVANGARFSISYPVGPNTMLTLEYVHGTALAAQSGSPGRLPTDPVRPRVAQGARVAARSMVHKLGTELAAAYVWQPKDLVTVLSPYSLPGDGAFLSVHLRQPIRSSGFLPRDAALTIDGKNLARQGYVAVASTDAESPAALAATLRTLQAGFSFSF